MVAPITPLRPQPMPDIRVPLTYRSDLQQAAARLDDVWNPRQLEEALRSIEFWVAQMRGCFRR